ncbi:hypothetical protein LTR72_000315 [Exophiala xenobiotica]|nr:hypothetical protein LTR41_001039 [Exophiala xenobiotica]KAK5231135.1 hypothetical protein LTR72_000315 [Exophiala xenobiotica]KAK5255036.1 hypothetical protein LTS06_000820 [Exophiala xenobiotica]KAK5299649.1 hypothetical protein LTR14_001863 [Exophiala xenobiotica]KAK5383901.1 hypothetical protein LTS13_002093 [Exophiala xenobiotica]
MSQEHAYLTGGASGIGRAVAQMLVKHNIKVFIADRDLEGAQKLVDELNKNGQVAKCAHVDVLDWNSQAKAFSQAVADSGRIDYVYPIAGVGERPSIINDPSQTGFEMPDLTVLDVDLTGVIYTVSLAVQQFRRQEPGKNGFRGKSKFTYLVTSLGVGVKQSKSVASRASAACTQYLRCPSIQLRSIEYSGVVGLTRSYGHYLPEEKITMNAVCPNVIRTGISTSAFYDSLEGTGLLAPIEGVVDTFEKLLGTDATSGECFEVGPNYKSQGAVPRKAPEFLDKESEKSRATNTALSFQTREDRPEVGTTRNTRIQYAESDSAQVKDTHIITTTSMPTQPSIFTPYLSPSLHSHLSSCPPMPIDIDSYARTPLARLQATALPQIGVIELVSSPQTFTQLYDALYKSSFPRRAERERSDLITARLAAQAAGTRTGLAPYRIVGIRDKNNQAIGAAQFSVLSLPLPQPQPLASTRSAARGAIFAVPYLQYIYIRPSSRRQDMSEVLHTFVLAVAAADAFTMARMASTSASSSSLSTTTTSVSVTVPFTLFETEPPDHGDDTLSRAYAAERSKIHTSTGGIALVLRRRHGDHKILSAHVQPGLEPDDPPLTLVWVIRQSPNPASQNYDIKDIGKHLVAAYYRSLRDEGFPEANICRAERMVEERCKGAEFHLMPLSEVKDFTDAEHLDMYPSD